MKLGIVLGIVAAVLLLTVGTIVVSADVAKETNNAEEDVPASCGCGSETCTGQCGGGCSANICGCKS